MKENEKDARLEEKFGDEVDTNALNTRSDSYNSDIASERPMYQREERILLKLTALPYLMPCCDY